MSTTCLCKQAAQFVRIWHVVARARFAFSFSSKTRALTTQLASVPNACGRLAELLQSTSRLLVVDLLSKLCLSGRGETWNPNWRRAVSSTAKV